MEFIPYNYIISAQVCEPTQSDVEEVTQAFKAFLTASNKPYTTEGKPKMLFLTAWMAHEGRNLNGDAFIKEELEKSVKKGLFVPPYAGMIDDDHDFTPRGYWWKTSFAYDKVAEKWGIIAHGAIWAWRFPELAERLTNEQTLNGNVKVSMSTMAESAEVRYDYPGYSGKKTNVLHNPIFFTTSTLSVPPGDEFARAEVSDEDDHPDPSGTNPVISISEVKMAKEKKATAAAEPAGSAPQEGLKALHRLEFPKAVWKSADAVLQFAHNEALGTWAVSEEAGNYVLLSLDAANFVPGSFVTTCITYEPAVGEDGAAACSIHAVHGTLKVEGPIEDAQVKALNEKSIVKSISPIQEAYRKYLAAKGETEPKELEGDSPDPDNHKMAAEDDHGEPGNKDTFHNEADKAAEPKAEPVKTDDKPSNYNKAEGAPEPAGEEPKTMDETCAKKDGEKPGDKENDKEPDNDEDDMSKAAVPGMPNKSTSGAPSNGMPDTHPSMVDPVTPTQHQDQSLGDGSTSNKSEPIKEDNNTMHSYSLDEYKAKLTEAELQVKSLAQAKADLELQLAKTKEELDNTKKQLTDYEARNKAEEESNKKLEARLAKLPKSVKAALEKHAEKDLIMDKWKKASDPEWDVIASSLSFARLGLSLLERSELEGRLPVGGSSATDTTKSLKSYLRD